MQVAELKVELADVAPPVRRVLEVPLDLRLDRLHLAIQAAMGWQNGHLYDFTAGRTARWAKPDPEFDDVVPPSKGTVADLFAAAGKRPALYTYDFGDNWEHLLTLGKPVEAEAGAVYPRLIDCTGRCPPEDCGGFPGFERFQKIMADPDDPEHEEMLDWHGGPFDPSDAGTAERTKAVAALAKRWAGKARG